MVLNRYNFIENINIYRHMDLFEDNMISKEELNSKLLLYKMALEKVIAH